MEESNIRPVTPTTGPLGIPEYVDHYTLESVGYDPVGNIMSLKRKGMTAGANCQEADYIDELEYVYYDDGVRLKSVEDASFGTMGQLGFKDGATVNEEYMYDENGNIRLDRNKGGLASDYNYLNLPKQIGQMTVLYDALGRKWSKTGESGTVYYIDGFEFRNNELEAVYAPDGRLVPDESASGPTNIDLRAEYWRQDHLGNTRVTFSDFNQNGRVDVVDNPTTIENELEITQESHYYPFGLRQEGDWYETVAPENKYLYNGKELSEDFGIDLYEYGFRWYDPAIGRFTGVDPIADQFAWVNTYNYAENEPVANIDLWGLQRLKVSGGIHRGRPYTKYPNAEMPNIRTEIGAGIKHPIASTKVGIYRSKSNNISSRVGRFAAHIDNKVGLDEGAGSSILSGGIGGYQNAIRHGLWSASISAKFGAEAATDITNSHEGISVDETAEIDWSKSFNGNPSLADSMVDFLNNQIGMNIGTQNPDASIPQLAKLVLTEFSEKGLWTATQDKDGNISIQRTRITEGQSRQGMHIVDNLLDENGREK